MPSRVLGNAFHPTTPEESSFPPNHTGHPFETQVPLPLSLSLSLFLSLSNIDCEHIFWSLLTDIWFLLNACCFQVWLLLLAFFATSHQHLPPSNIASAAWPIPLLIHLWEWPSDVAVFSSGLPQFANLPNPGDRPSPRAPQKTSPATEMNTTTATWLRQEKVSFSLCFLVLSCLIYLGEGETQKIITIIGYWSLWLQKEKIWSDQLRIKKCLILNRCRPTICLCGLESQPGCKEQPGQTLLEVSSSYKHY